MDVLPVETVTHARSLLAAGWRPVDPVGRVEHPLGFQLTAAQWVSDWCWQAMVLTQQQTQPVRS